MHYSKIKTLFITSTRFFYEQHFYKQRWAEFDKRIKQMLSSRMRLNFGYLKLIHIFYPRHRKIQK